MMGRRVQDRAPKPSGPLLCSGGIFPGLETTRTQKARPPIHICTPKSGNWGTMLSLPLYGAHITTVPLQTPSMVTCCLPSSLSLPTPGPGSLTIHLDGPMSFTPAQPLQAQCLASTPLPALQASSADSPHGFRSQPHFRCTLAQLGQGPLLVSLPSASGFPPLHTSSVSSPTCTPTPARPPPWGP